MSRRYVIARCEGYMSDLPMAPEAADLEAVLCELPDAEHVHLHRQPDGTYKAWPMTEYDCDCGRASVSVEGHAFWCAWCTWADAPLGGDA
jgi:hypothetical protein